MRLQTLSSEATMYDDNRARMCGNSDHWLGKNMKESADQN
jgi:hypothetical protein